jgi:hypothetical protein
MVASAESQIPKKETFLRNQPQHQTSANTRLISNSSRVSHACSHISPSWTSHRYPTSALYGKPPHFPIFGSLAFTCYATRKPQLTGTVTLSCRSIDAQGARHRLVRCHATRDISSVLPVMASAIQRPLSRSLSGRPRQASIMTTIISKVSNVP